MRGYTMPLAGPARAGLVSALPRQYTGFRPAVSTLLTAALGEPVAVALDAESSGVLYHFRKGAVVEHGRVQTGLPTAPDRDTSLVALREGPVIGDELHGWDFGVPRMLDPSAPRGRILVSGLQHDAWLTVRQNATDTTVDAITIRRTNFVGSVLSQTRIDAGFGCAAVSASGLIGLALSHGTFLVINGGSLHERFELRRTPAPYLVSALPAGWGLVSAVPDSDASTAPVEQRVRTLGVPGVEIRGTWRSHVECIADDGSTRWWIDVPFAVLQPPVDGGEPRCYLVGKGLAAVDAGRLVWHKAANVRLAATCFGNGALAVAMGFSVRIIARDGRTLQTLTVPDRSHVVTLPAIGMDGAIYVGTATGFYVAR